MVASPLPWAGSSVSISGLDTVARQGPAAVIVRGTARGTGPPSGNRSSSSWTETESPWASTGTSERTRARNAILRIDDTFSGAGQELLGHALDVGRLDEPLVALHDVAQQAPQLLGVGDPERGQALLDQRAQGRLVQPPRQVPLAELDLEARLRHLGRPPLARLLELGERLLELLAVRGDDVQDQRVVHLAREALGRAPLHQSRLEHPHHVGGALVPA